MQLLLNRAVYRRARQPDENCEIRCDLVPWAKTGLDDPRMMQGEDKGFDRLFHGLLKFGDRVTAP